LNVDADSYAIMGMCALSVSVIGGPPTMTFIALETTDDLWLTTAVLIAAIIAMQATREFFEYSFAIGGFICAARVSAGPLMSDGFAILEWRG
jgi:chloride channel protein, CIC family